ncbi:MAG: hypothetical protein H6755_05290 [Candidatus Omnitrophica bacterium]|nr:cell division protein FtsQ/DivIB [Candidatus Omnitrophota bacterium]MCB9747806.1 hypothetical protein [Candidatus Omnitrophota bacterium]
MARKKKLKIPPSLFKFFIVGILSLTFGLLIVHWTVRMVVNSSYFRVSEIGIDPSLHFINKSELAKLQGMNIFTVDLGEIQQRLRLRYPQMTELKVIKRFPNKILIQAKKREPFAQMEFKKKILTIDHLGVVLSSTSQKEDRLPFIIGMDEKYANVTVGRELNQHNMQIGLKILREFQAQPLLSITAVKGIDISKLSKIILNLNQGIEVYLDHENIDQRMQILSLIFSQSDFDIEQVKYIDLRFKEPRLGKK